MAEAAPGDAVALNEESAVSAVEPSPAPTPMSPAPPSGPKGPRAGGFGQAEDAGSSRTLQGADSAESVDVASVGFTPRIAKTAFGHDEQLIAAAAASSPSSSRATSSHRSRRTRSTHWGCNVSMRRVNDPWHVCASSSI